MDKKIMIVDDAMFMRKVIKRALSQGGGWRNSNRDISEGNAGSYAP